MSNYEALEYLGVARGTIVGLVGYLQDTEENMGKILEEIIEKFLEERGY